MHRLMWLHHVLRAPDDGSGGGGGVPEPPAQETSQAQGSADLLTQIEQMMDRKMASQKDSIHADIRRQLDGYRKEKAPEPKQTTTTTTDTGLGRDDVRQLIARERMLGDAMAAANLSHGARNRMQKAFEAESPEDVGAWAKGYLDDFGLGKPSAGATTETKSAPPTHRDGPPVTGNSAPAGAPPVDENTPIWKLTPDQKADLVARKGNHWVRNKMREQLRNTKVLVRNL